MIPAYEETPEPEEEVKPWERLQVEVEVFHKGLGLGTVKSVNEKEYMFVMK